MPCCFIIPKQASGLNGMIQWWQFIEGANWKQTQGPDRTTEDKINHIELNIGDEKLALFRITGNQSKAEFEHTQSQHQSHIKITGNINILATSKGFEN